MRAHFIQDGDLQIVFFPESYRFAVINAESRRLIESICQNRPEEDAQAQWGITSEGYAALHRQVRMMAEPLEMPETQPGKTLERLVLNVSNDCNLNCRYCYANGGRYAGPAGQMTEATALRAIEVCLHQFEYIELIQLFGGEPFLNVPVIKAVLAYLREHLPASKVTNTPIVGVVTNGTILTEEILTLIRQYDLMVTVSLDGPQEIHDSMRPFRGGQGSHELIMHNLRIMRERTGQPSMIEATYHRGHVESGIRQADLMGYFAGHFPGTDIHIAPVFCRRDDPNSPDDLSSFVASIDDLFDSMASAEAIPLMSVKELLNKLTAKTCSRTLCNAGLHSLAVNAQGELYPCYLYVDHPAHRMGTVFAEHPFQTEEYLRVRDHFASYSKLTHDPCASCIANFLCKSCLWRNELITGNKFTVAKEFCDMYRQIVERTIVRLARQNGY